MHLSLKEAMKYGAFTFALLGLVALLRCESEPAGVAPPAIDAARSDVAVTKPRDASSQDASTDAVYGTPDVPPGWRWFSAFGPSCPSYMVPIDPVAQMPKLTWQSCATLPFPAISTCNEWDTSTWHNPAVSLGGFAHASSDGRILSIAHVVDDASTELYDGQQIVYDRASLAPLAAFRWRGAPATIFSNCQMRIEVGGFGAPTLFTSHTRFGFVSGTPGQLMNSTAFPQFVPSYTPVKDISQDVNGSDTTLAFTSFAGIVRVKRSDMSWVRAARYLTLPLVVADDVFAIETLQDWTRITRVEANGDVTLIRDVPQRHLHGYASDGVYLYWMEQYGAADPMGFQPHLELWRSKIVRDVALFNANAERIVSLDGQFLYSAFSMAHDGVFMTSNAESTLLVRTSDKRVKTLTTAANVVEARAYYVDQNELWLQSRIAIFADIHYQKISIDW
jgi:hypothetical protein